MTACPGCGADAALHEAWMEWHIECSHCHRFFYVPDRSALVRRVATLSGAKWERA